LLYASVPHKHSVLVIDTATMKETRAIQIGGTPALALALVAP
jgi:YVTN family beta-propeller protein